MFAQLKKNLLDLIFPAFCQGCGAEGSYLCPGCSKKIEIPLQRCAVCGRNAPLSQTHSECRPGFSLTGLFVAADYGNEAIKKLIWNLKYSSVKDITEPLATVLADFFFSFDLQEYFYPALIVPVPIHKKRARERGFNQAELLAKLFAAKTGIEFAPILSKINATPSQVKFNREERQQNLLGAFTCAPHPSLGERKVILIDDVVSTGATLNECGKCLRKQGAGEIWGLVVARN